MDVEGGMIKKRSAPVLLAGFGMLIGLIAVTGIGALQRARETYQDVSRLNDRYRRSDRVLNGIASGIYKVGLLTRDYLLDPSNLHAAEYRSDLVQERTLMEKEFAELGGVVQNANKPKLERLRSEVNAYWDALDPLFQWTTEEKATRSWTFSPGSTSSKRGGFGDRPGVFQAHPGQPRRAAAGTRP